MTQPKKKQPLSKELLERPDSAFCRISHSFSPHSHHRLSHIGSYILWRITMNQGLGVYLWLMKISLFISLALFLASLGWPDPLLAWQEIASLAGLIVFAIPCLWRSALLEFSQKKSRLIESSDLWISMFAIVFLLEDFPAIAPWKPLFAFTFCNLWIWLRFLEAKAWRNKLAPHFTRQDRLWFRSVEMRSSFLPLMLASTLLFLVAWIVKGPLSLSLLPLVWAAACWPAHIILLNKLFQESENSSWKVFDWRFFRDLRFVKIILSHFQGVFTQPNLQVNKLWIESIHEWPERSILEILHKVARTNSHPMSEALMQFLQSPETDLIELSEVSLAQHLGVRGIVKDVQGGSSTFVFGSLGWHRILQTSMSDDGRQFLRSAIDSNQIVSLLSLNDTIVAAVALKSQIRTDAEEAAAKLSSDFRWGLVSSASMKWTPKILPATVDFELFPVEREMIRLQAEDRFNEYRFGTKPVAAEIVASWDLQSPAKWNRLLVSPLEQTPADLSKTVVQLYSSQVSDICRPFVASTWLNRAQRLAWGIQTLSILVVLLIPQPEFGALLLAIVLILSTWWFLQSKIE